MKKILIIILIFTSILIGRQLMLNYQLKIIKEDKHETPSKIISISNSPINRIDYQSVFVPSWMMNYDHNESYDRYIYFGNIDGIRDFKNKFRNQQLWTTYKVVTIDELQQLRINNDELTDFTGIVLDLEISSLLTQDQVNQVNQAVKQIYTQLNKQGIKLALAIYGDLFFRYRNYDLKTLNQYSDEIMIMAYDFSKSYGEPGGNFPINEFKDMINDFLTLIPKDKITVIFGMYGYQWELKDKKPVTRATALTLNQIIEKFISNGCLEKNCKYYTDSLSKEKIISFDKDNSQYIIFFEDHESVATKSKYLMNKGIGNIAFWAWGYY